MQFFLAITADLKAGDLDDFDKSVTTFIFNYRSDFLSKIMIGITEMGSQWAYLALIPIIAFLLFNIGQSWRLSIQATIILISTFFLNLGMKYLFGRPRPLIENHLIEVSKKSFSYPSGHTMGAVAFYGFTIYLTYRFVENIWLRWFLIAIQFVLIVLIGVSRVYLGVHYPSDVAAGFIAGFIWLAICIVALRSINLYRKRKRKKRALLESKE